MIRVVAYLVFVFGLVQQHLLTPVLVIFLILVWFLWRQPQFHWGPWLKSLWRLKWFFGAIAVLYLWYTPGEGWLNHPYSPTIEGSREAVLKVMVLVTILSATRLLMLATPTEALIQSLHRMVQPLSWWINPERFAVRVVLTMEAFDQIHRLMAATSQPAATVQPGRSRMQRIQERMLAVFKEVENQALSQPLRPMGLGRIPLPPWWQWLIPPLVAAVMGGIILCV